MIAANSFEQFVQTRCKLQPHSLYFELATTIMIVPNTIENNAPHFFLLLLLHIAMSFNFLLSLQKNGRHWKSTVSKCPVSRLTCCFFSFDFLKIVVQAFLQKIANRTTQNICQPAAVLINIVPSVYVRTNDRVYSERDREISK